MTTEADLAGLIAQRKGTRSYGRLAKDCGGTPGPQRIHQLATLPLKNFPDPDTVNGLAAGLGATVTEVVMAASRSLGLNVRTGYDPDALVLADAGTLSDSAREAIATIARELLALSRAADREELMGNAEHPAPIEPPTHEGPRFTGPKVSDEPAEGGEVTAESLRRAASRRARPGVPRQGRN